MNVQINQGVVQGVTCEGEADSAAELEEQARAGARLCGACCLMGRVGLLAH